MPVFEIRATKTVEAVFIVTADTEKQADTIVWHKLENEPDREPVGWIDKTHITTDTIAIYDSATILYHD